MHPNSEHFTIHPTPILHLQLQKIRQRDLPPIQRTAKNLFQCCQKSACSHFLIKCTPDVCTHDHPHKTTVLHYVFIYIRTYCMQPNSCLPTIQFYCLKLAHAHVHVHVHACGKHALQKHHHGNQPGHMAICNLMALGNAMYTYRT